MFEYEFHRRVEKLCKERLQGMLGHDADPGSGSIFCVSSLVDLWEKSEDVARRVALLGDTDPLTAMSGDYDEDYDDVSEIKPRAFSNLFLAIRCVLIHQPDRTEGDAGLFAGTIEMERRLFEDPLDPDSISSRWPTDHFRQFCLVRKYRMVDDSLARMVLPRCPNSCTQGEALYVSFYDNYIFSSDLDEEYELYIRQFCRLTVELAGLCSCYCEAMSTWCGGGYETGTSTASGSAERDLIARVILYARAISAFGIRFGYAQWLDTLDSRL